MHSSLHRRLLQMALIPALVFALVMTTYFAVSQNWRAEQAFEDQITALTRTAGPAVAAALRSGDTMVLDDVAQEILNSPHSRSVSVLLADGTEPLQRGPDIMLDNPPAPGDDLTTHWQDPWVRVLLPVTLDAARNEGPDAWFQVDYSTNNIKLDSYRLTALGAIIALTGLIIVWLLTLGLSRSITRPFYLIMDVVRTIADGQRGQRITLSGQNDLQALGHGINQMADSLQHAHQEMQQSVDQATQDLRETLETLEIQNIQLSTARRQALEANEAKTQFLANMSHEIRTPLNGVLGFVKLLDRTELTQKQRDYVTTIQHSSEGLMTIINDILDFLKLDAGKLELERRSMNLRDVVEDVLDIMAPMAHEKNLELAAMVYDDVPLQVIGDPLRLRQVILNLVNNAIKFTQAGHVAVRVASEGQHRDQVRLRLAVSDTGPGIPRDKQKALFQAFNQTDASTSRKFGGTGLGLVICQRLVNRMGGKIELDSVEQEGSTFSLLMNFELDATEHTEDTSDLLAGTRTLVWEPNELSRLTLQHRLEKWGMTVSTLPDVPASQAFIEPLDGVDTVALLTYEARHASWLRNTMEACQAMNIPVLLMTCHNDASAALRPLEALATAVTTKPMRYHRLYSLCHRLLSPETEARTPNPVRLPRVLVVDDNATNRKLLVTFLGDFGIQPDEAENGSDAMALISQQTYDLVFMDIQMPVMDGVTATREIRRHEAPGQHLPVVALTAHALPHERNELMQSGFDDYLTKPISEQQLTDTIRQWTGADLGSHPYRPAPVAPGSQPATDTPVDFQLGLQRAGGKPALARDMYAGLLEQLREAQWQLSPIMDDQDHDALLEWVHALHSVTRYCGTPELEQALRTLEDDIKRGKSEHILGGLEHLQAAIDRVIDWSDRENWDQWLEEASSPAL